MIVADLNLVVQLLLPGQRTAEAEAVFWRDPEWATPLCWRSGFQGVLAGYEAGGALKVPQATALMADAEILFRGREYLTPAEPVLRTVAASGLPPAACELAVLAHDLAVPLVTMDPELLWAFPEVAVSPLQFC